MRFSRGHGSPSLSLFSLTLGAGHAMWETHRGTQQEGMLRYEGSWSLRKQPCGADGQSLRYFILELLRDLDTQDERQGEKET